MHAPKGSMRRCGSLRLRCPLCLRRPLRLHRPMGLHHQPSRWRLRPRKHCRLHKESQRRKSRLEVFCVTHLCRRCRVRQPPQRRPRCGKRRRCGRLRGFRQLLKAPATTEAPQVWQAWWVRRRTLNRKVQPPLKAAPSVPKRPPPVLPSVPSPPPQPTRPPTTRSATPRGKRPPEGNYY